MNASPKKPSDETIIWRYMGLDKFLDLLINDTITFTKATIASDKNEIKWILKNLEETDEYKTHSEGAIKHIEKLRDTSYISCWTMKERESRPLWATYLDNSKQGVAIKTTVKKLINSIVWDDFDPSYQIVDYRDDFVFEELQSLNIAINTKNPAYLEESEVRFHIFCDDNHLPDRPEFEGIKNIVERKLTKRSENGKTLKFDINLNSLVSNIMISPYCSSWQRKNIEKLIENYHPELINRILESTIME
ncbi:hypothetical protein ACG2LH_11600 [Zhouia sp. PK063]|uniref:hypothetical protein n=1 Tax=Zhouia sp. PK063 TaxID=3373602 RepID=UPI0037B9407F